MLVLSLSLSLSLLFLLLLLLSLSLVLVLVLSLLLVLVLLLLNKCKGSRSLINPYHILAFKAQLLFVVIVVHGSYYVCVCNQLCVSV